VLSVVAPFELANKYIWKFYQQSYQSLSYKDKLDTERTENRLASDDSCCF
jgi:hypothetical protein